MGRSSMPMTRSAARDEMHFDLLARNIFAITIVGAVAFVAACAWVMAT